MQEQTQILFESLRRTDTYILAADQKASFCLAAGITFLGIYSTLFFSVITDEKTAIATITICVILGIVLVPWLIFFHKIKNIFSPNLEPSSADSIVSFASMRATCNNLQHFKNHYQTISSQNFTQSVENDILENHWICAGICLDKMKNFKKALFWLWVALSISIAGLATLILFV